LGQFSVSTLLISFSSWFRCSRLFCGQFHSFMVCCSRGLLYWVKTIQF